MGGLWPDVPSDHSHFFAIWLIDLLFTPLFLIGWIVALLWAFVDPKKHRIV